MKVNMSTTDKKSQEEMDARFRALMRLAEKIPGYTINPAIVEAAYRMAREKHEGKLRYSGDPYIIHPLAVMETLMRLHCSSTVLAAGLLHDTMEDCGVTREDLREHFSEEVAEIVDAVTAIKRDEADRLEKGLSPLEFKDYRDQLTDAKLLQSPLQRDALMVRMADREHNLSTLDACSLDKRRLKIDQTKSFLIKAAKELHMRYFYVTLSDYCLKYMQDTADGPCECVDELETDESDIYQGILLQRNRLIRTSGEAFQHFDNVLTEAVNGQNYFMFSPFCPLNKLRGSRDEGEGVRQPIRRILRPFELYLQTKGQVCFTRQQVCLSEVVLVCNAVDKRDILSQFLAFHRKYLQSVPLYFRFSYEDSEALVVTLTDEMENNYRILLLPTSKLAAYYMGDPNEGRLLLHGEDAVNDAVRPKMRVYTYAFSPDQQVKIRPHTIPKGATALDLAFHVKTQLAATVIDAQIKKYRGEGPIHFSQKDYHYPLKTILSDGDIVHFEADYTPPDARVDHTSINWVTYVNTNKALSELISLLKAKYPELSE